MGCRSAIGADTGLFDDVVDRRGFVLLAIDDDPGRFLSPAVREAWERLGGLSVQVAPGAAVDDVDCTYARWFAEPGVGVAAFRPDFYVFGTAVSAADSDGLVEAFLRSLGVLPAGAQPAAH